MTVQYNNYKYIWTLFIVIIDNSDFIVVFCWRLYVIFKVIHLCISGWQRRRLYILLWHPSSQQLTRLLWQLINEKQITFIQNKMSKSHFKVLPKIYSFLQNKLATSTHQNWSHIMIDDPICHTVIIVLK